MPTSPEDLSAINPTPSPSLQGLKQGINIAGDTVTLATAPYPEDHRKAVRRLYALAKEAGWDWADLEHHVKLDTTTLYRVFNGSYRNPKTGDPVPLGGVVQAIDRFFELWEARSPETRLPFIETSVWRRIYKLCQEALEMQATAMIYGESQIGKTACLREFQRRKPHGDGIYLLMPASAGVQSMMKAIADACHISQRTSFEQLRQRVRNFLDDSKLLLIDEVHECFVSYHKASMLKCLAVLRQLQEESGCGLVLCGTNVWRHELEQGEFAQALKQLCRRGIWSLQLEAVPTQSDLRLIAAHYRLPEPEGEPADLVRFIAHQSGLGKYTKFLHRAALLAKKRDQKMSWDHFTKVVAVADTLTRAPKSDWTK